MLIPKLYIFNPGFSLSYMEQIGAYLVCGSWQLEARWGGGWVEATFANFNSISSPVHTSHLALPQILNSALLLPLGTLSNNKNGEMRASFFAKLRRKKTENLLSVIPGKDN